jgi:hypothetical protein
MTHSPRHLPGLGRASIEQSLPPVQPDESV